MLDRKGSGVINGGTELFGDNTPGAAGALAANGFIALQGQDHNADGQINSQDTSYTQLRVWRDPNQDGISQAGELQTLSQAGIASIGVVGTATNVNLAAMTNGCAVGNTQIASGSFTRTNGSTGQSVTAELTGSYLLAGNNKRYFIGSCSRNVLLTCRPKRHENYLATLKDPVSGTTCRARYVSVRTNECKRICSIFLMEHLWTTKTKVMPILASGCVS